MVDILFTDAMLSMKASGNATTRRHSQCVLSVIRNFLLGMGLSATDHSFKVLNNAPCGKNQFCEHCPSKVIILFNIRYEQTKTVKLVFGHVPFEHRK